MNTGTTNESTNTLGCNQNATTVAQIQIIFESGDITNCNGCSNFVYQNGICGCKHLNH